MELFGQTISVGSGIFLLLALGLALSFEFVNGFHDTANAVATVIYTHALKPKDRSHLVGMLELDRSPESTARSLSAYSRCFLWSWCRTSARAPDSRWSSRSCFPPLSGTWAPGILGLPASSSHTLVGAIMGVGLANSWLSGNHEFGEGSTGPKLRKSVIPAGIAHCRLICAALLLCRARRSSKFPTLYSAPEKDKAPPLWIRGLLFSPARALASRMVPTTAKRAWD